MNYDLDFWSKKEIDDILKERIVNKIKKLSWCMYQLYKINIF